jgi:hypothetical protein
MTSEVEIRPMTPGERQALSRIIKNTFETLMSELETLRLEAVNTAEREYAERVENTRERRHELHIEVTAKLEEIKEQYRVLESTLTIEGFEINWDNSYYRPTSSRWSEIKITDRQHKVMLEQRKQQVQHQYNKAVEILRRKKLDADKELLLTAIKTEEAKAFMDSLPSATSLFALALES